MSLDSPTFRSDHTVHRQSENVPQNVQYMFSIVKSEKKNEKYKKIRSPEIINLISHRFRTFSEHF